MTSTAVEPALTPTPLIVAGANYECSYTDQVTGSSGEDKLRVVSASGVSDDPVPGPVSGSDSITIPITDRPIQEIFLPGIIDDVVEPNNTCQLAYPLQLNRQYSFFPPAPYSPPPDPVQDYYVFRLTEEASVTVEMTNFVPRRGQLIVRTGVDCNPDSLETLGQNANAALNKVLVLGTQPPGQYFIQITNDGPAETQQLYGLIVKTQ